MRNIISLVIISSNNILFFFFFQKSKPSNCYLFDQITFLLCHSLVTQCFVLFCFIFKIIFRGLMFYLFLVFISCIFHQLTGCFVQIFFFSLKVTFILEVVIICILSSPYHSKFSQGFKDLIYRPCIAEFKPCIGKHLQTYCVCHFSHPQPTPVPPI